MPLRVVLLSALVGVLGGPAAAAAAAAAPAPPEPNARTPEGEATLESPWRGAHTLEGRWPEVLVAWRVGVGPGGAAGPVRVRARSAIDPSRGTQVGPWVDLPATPGAYTFPAPHLTWDYRDGVLGLDQQVGGHAIVRAEPCQPGEDAEYVDPCRLTILEAWRPILGLEGPQGRPPDEQRRGNELAIIGLTEPDIDGDRVGDDTEDRTDLRLTARTGRVRGGRQRVVLTVRNAGPRRADRVTLAQEREHRPDEWQSCVSAARAGSNPAGRGRPGFGPHCLLHDLGGLDVGRAKTIVVGLPLAKPGRVRFDATSEGRELRPGGERLWIRVPQRAR